MAGKGYISYCIPYNTIKSCIGRELNAMQLFISGVHIECFYWLPRYILSQMLCNLWLMWHNHLLSVRLSSIHKACFFFQKPLWKGIYSYPSYLQTVFSIFQNFEFWNSVLTKVTYWDIWGPLDELVSIWPVTRKWLSIGWNEWNLGLGSNSSPYIVYIIDLIERSITWVYKIWPGWVLFFNRELQTTAYYLRLLSEWYISI